MRRPAWTVAALLLALGRPGDAGTMGMVVADVPYGRVWEAAVRAVRDYPVERAAEAAIATGWRERAPDEREVGFERIRERVTVRVEPFAERITRVSVDVEAQGWRDGQWVPIANTESVERAILDRIRGNRG